MSNKNILYIGGFELPDKNAAAHRVLGIAKSLRDLGYNITFISLDKDINYKTDISNHNEIDGFLYYPIKYPTTIYSWINHLFYFNVKKSFINRLNPSIIIAYNFPSIALLRLFYYYKKKKVKIISDCTEWYQPLGSLFYKVIKKFDTEFRMKYVNKKINGIIAISRFLENYYKNCKTVYVPPTIDKSDQKWINPYLNNENKSIILCYVGSTGIIKDRLDVIIQALNKCKQNIKTNFIFNIIGLTYEKFQNNFDCDIPSFVFFKGRIPHKDAIEYIKKSDFQIFIRENNLVCKAGFPTKFVETVSCGTLVLTNASSNLIDYIERCNLGFILDNSSISSLSKSLLSPLQMNREQINNAKKKAYSNHIFDYRSYTKSISDFINNLD